MQSVWDAHRPRITRDFRGLWFCKCTCSSKSIPADTQTIALRIATRHLRTVASKRAQLLALGGTEPTSERIDPIRALS